MSRAEKTFARYFTKRGWIHILLLLGVWLFMFPFVWMVATSLETEQEYSDAAMFPALVKYRPAGPYVIEVGNATRPPDVSGERWREIEPKLLTIARKKIEQSKRGESDAHRNAATTLLVSSAVARLDRHLWLGADAALENEFKNELSDALVDDAIRQSLARIELLDFQLRSGDGHIYDLTQGSAFAKTWRVESGNATLNSLNDSTQVGYAFDSSNPAPIVLRYDFDPPSKLTMDDLHAIILSIKADNSWHRIDLSLDINGQRWQSDETNYLAQFRAVGFTFQPPGFDDTSLRAKRWTTLNKIGESRETSSRAILRVSISPSSALRANFGKAFHNFDLAFKSVPFWKYIFNSILLVLLSTAGAIFSATFVAYAFARLNWPGRSVAFVLLLATMMLPSQVTMIPGFLIWRYVHWYNTLNPLWVPSFLGSAFFIFLMTQHMRTIPRDLEEAARIDGLNAVQSWYYIILPNVKPSLAAITILSFIGSWNDFLGPLVYLRDQTKFPLSLGLYGLNLMHAVDAAQFPSTMIMAGNVLMTLPIIAVFLIFQRYFVQGMSMTGMKS